MQNVCTWYYYKKKQHIKLRSYFWSIFHFQTDTLDSVSWVKLSYFIQVHEIKSCCRYVKDVNEKDKKDVKTYQGTGSEAALCSKERLVDDS